MTNYHVNWAIDIEAQTPVEAAQIALETQRDKDSLATCFVVREGSVGGLSYEIDVFGDEPQVHLLEPGSAPSGNVPAVDTTPGVPAPQLNPNSVQGRIQRIIDWTQRYYKLDFTATELSEALELVVRSNMTPEAAAAEVYGKRPVDSRKPFDMIVRVEIAYSIPADILPKWVDACGLEKVIESAFDDWNKPLTLEALGKGGVLDMEPVEITLDTVLQG